MVPNKMEVYAAPVNVWNKDAIRPGPVGTVGDVLLGVRLKQSAPELAQRWDAAYSGKNEVYSGSNVSDGYSAGFTTGGGVARTIIKRMPYRQGFKTPVGWIKEDIKPVDRNRTALMGSLGQYSWDSQVNGIKRAGSTGEFFKPLPEGYERGVGQQPRGSQIPRIVAESTGEGNALPPTEVKITDPDFGERGSIPNPAGNQPQAPGWRKVYLYPTAHWVPAVEDRRNNTPPETYRYYVWSYAQEWWPEDDPEKEQKVWDRLLKKYVEIRLSSKGVLGRPEMWDGKPVGEAPFKYISVDLPNTPVGGPIAKPGGWRDKPTKFVGASYDKRIRIR